MMFAEFFKDKNYLVTAASGGIGVGIVKALATEGANVGIHYSSRYENALKSKKAVEDSKIFLISCFKYGFLSLTVNG